ncbi:RNA 2',3'-cyclic phosphodiesterase [Streptomyces sp. ACA25]|uniref:RNA 2',3'-cyclic phosphodiesterase n=1 Tax=Streptomyces sp. ACA25 TaxID=3022596 RepID=UPI0023083471|nr:RNA 2',3'-cyclic phosphodiesterase [Streptomyces sp. ACA25]MDB1086049.1 RNA 2',3'-cyclic phosphodiesterase [Streptomyces sp. ACA25]
MRTFAALLLPPPTVAALAAVTGKLRTLPGADRLRWTEEDGWHVTLAFYGATGPEVLPELETRLARVAGRRAPFEVRAAGGGRFGDRVLWAGVNGDRQALSRLAAGASAAGRKAGVAHRESARRFHPHVTLARARGRSGGPDLAAHAAALEDFAGAPWQVTRLVLMRSVLPDGHTPGEQPRYTREGSWPLGR